MSGKILAGLMLILGGSVTLYILYKGVLAVLQPVVQKKLQQKMAKDKYDLLENSLQLHQQVDQTQVKKTQQKMKK
ncbi:MAG: hypothetical protein CVV03_03120 [Firmicutes bacterium HGW-Firmicutes-8]|nr:MAG: hypothetical protein CVV03_03120 [Firmicutes bacterium HGW-Firmicutes-8]